MNSPAPAAETHVACLTPPGVGAIASLGLHGPRAWQVVRELFRLYSASQAELPSEPEIGRFWLGRLGHELADQVVLIVKETQPVASLEVHCHGGREVLRLLLETFEAHGIQTCAWQEFERLTSGDLTRSAAVAALADAPTVRTAAILLDQYHGVFERSIAAILSAWDRGESDEAGRLLEGLARYAGVGRHLTVPWRVVVAGAPNVGKSSLVNALAGYQRCVIASTPGTTRDIVTTTIAIDGWPVELADTAGLREAAGGLEEQGISLARSAATDADLCLWVLDASVPPIWPDFPMERLRAVVNKMDLQATWDLERAGDAVRVSARTGVGLDELCQAISKWLVPDPPQAGAAVPFTPELCACVEASWHYCLTGQTRESRLALQQYQVKS